MRESYYISADAVKEFAPAECVGRDGTRGKAPPTKPLPSWQMANPQREADAVASAFRQLSAFFFQRGESAQRGGALTASPSEQLSAAEDWTWIVLPMPRSGAFLG